MFPPKDPKKMLKEAPTVEEIPEGFVDFRSIDTAEKKVWQLLEKKVVQEAKDMCYWNIARSKGASYRECYLTYFSCNTLRRSHLVFLPFFEINYGCKGKANDYTVLVDAITGEASGTAPGFNYAWLWAPLVGVGCLLCGGALYALISKS